MNVRDYFMLLFLYPAIQGGMAFAQDTVGACYVAEKNCREVTETECESSGIDAPLNNVVNEDDPFGFIERVAKQYIWLPNRSCITGKYQTVFASAVDEDPSDERRAHLECLGKIVDEYNPVIELTEELDDLESAPEEIVDQGFVAECKQRSLETGEHYISTYYFATTAHYDSVGELATTYLYNDPLVIQDLLVTYKAFCGAVFWCRKACELLGDCDENVDEMQMEPLEPPVESLEENEETVLEMEGTSETSRDENPSSLTSGAHSYEYESSPFIDA
jgi:hypothetical protein